MSDAGSSRPPPAEPIESPTLARLFAAQGRIERAAAMLESLAARRGDPALAAEAAALRAGAEPPAARPGIEARWEPTHLEVAWALPAERAAAARRIAGGPEAELVVRVVALAADADAALRARAVDELATGAEGSACFAGVGRDARVAVSVGWRGPTRFVSVVHTRVPPAPGVAPGARVSHDGARG